MRWLKSILFLLAVVLFQEGPFAQKRSKVLQDKDFYLISVLENSKAAAKAIAGDQALSAFLTRDRQRITQQSKLQDLMFGADTAAVLIELASVYAHHRLVFDLLIAKQLKPSGRYYRFNRQDNKGFFLNCWRETFKGINTIIQHYGLNDRFRYAAIDSASYTVKSEAYTEILQTLFSYLKERNKSDNLFYQRSLAVALQLLVLNNRDEAARFEPLETGENKFAIWNAKTISWKKYDYSAILVPGEGLEDGQRDISPVGKMRCDLAADRYFQKQAPFIIVSGGYVHPFQTPYCEAYEMKKYLIAQCHVPATAIIMEPQARHTTTNFRDSERLMIRYGFPINKPALCVTTKDQADYIEDPKFDLRNIKELGYVPYINKKRLSDHELSFNLVKDCLQIDSIDPLDP